MIEEIYGMDDIVVGLTSTGTFAIAAFGALYCLMQTPRSTVGDSFAAFLAAVALNNSPDAFRRLIEVWSGGQATLIEFAVWPSSFFLAPLFWIYVFVLTSDKQHWPRPLGRHFVLPGLATGVAILVLVSPPHVLTALTADDGKAGTGWEMAIVVAVGLLQLAVYPQISIYLFLILRRLVTFRERLRHVYASTEQHELRWIYVVGGLAVLFWLTLTVLLILVFDPEQKQAPPTFIVVASLVSFALVAATTLWGLRQRPPLQPDADVSMPNEPDTGQPGGKYEKSALGKDALQRLSRKLRAAMEVDHLYRDPNLSLWTLARHIGASSNYISQTLNAEIGESFFDFVNRYRVSEAMTLLATTDSSILTITYDVGFNARSSFYNAFKRINGDTPSGYRKKMSRRDGLDEVKI